MTIPDPDHSQVEKRFIILGKSHSGKLLVVVHADPLATRDPGRCPGYSPTPPDSFRDFGIEAVATLITEIEKHRNRLAEIVAGCPEEMQRFIESNPGLEWFKLFCSRVRENAGCFPVEKMARTFTSAATVLVEPL